MPFLEDPGLLRAAAYVDGAWFPDGESGCIEVDDPATGEVIGEVPALSRGQVTGRSTPPTGRSGTGGRCRARNAQRCSGGGST